MNNKGDRPAMTMIYDGACDACRRGVAWTRRLDWLGLVESVSLTAEDEVGARFPGIEPEDLQREMHVVDREGRVFRGFFALRRLARALPLLWAIWPLLHLPGLSAAGRVLYGRYAASRSRGGGSCSIHDTPDRPGD